MRHSKMTEKAFGKYVYSNGAHISLLFLFKKQILQLLAHLDPLMTFSLHPRFLNCTIFSKQKQHHGKLRHNVVIQCIALFLNFKRLGFSY